MNIIIIGAGKGISSSVAKLFGQNGFNVCLVARNEDKLQQEVSALASMNIVARYKVADAGNEQQLIAVLNDDVQQHGTPDVILYNAYAPNFKKLEQETWENIQAQMNVNVGGAFAVLKNFLPAAMKSGKGKFFFTGGGLSMYPQTTLVGLSMGKAALRNLVMSSALAAKPKSVHVATVTVCGFVKETDPKYNPDLIANEFWKLWQQTPEQFQTEIVY